MKRLFALIAATLLALLFLPATAQAVPPPDQIGTPINCHTKSGVDFGEDPTYTVKVCSTFHWRTQNDGSGVYLEAVNIWVADGCGELENDNPINDLWVGIGEPGGTSVVGFSPSAMNDCSAYRDLELRGQDVGASEAVLSMNVRVDTASDHRASHTCIIRPSNPDDCSTWHN